MANFVIEVATDKEVYSEEDLLKEVPSSEMKDLTQDGPDQVRNSLFSRASTMPYGEVPQYEIIIEN